MTIRARELLRITGYYVPWSILMLFVAVQAWRQSEYNDNATAEREQRIQYTDSIERLDGARAIADQDGKIREWNHGMVDLFGYTQDEALGRSVEFIMAEEMRDAHRRAFVSAMTQSTYGTVHEMTCKRATAKSGKELDVTIRVRVEERKGKPVAITTFDRAANVDKVDVATIGF